MYNMCVCVCLKSVILVNKYNETSRKLYFSFEGVMKKIYKI